MESFQGLAHIGIYTPDIEKSMGFYQDFLGFQLERQASVNKPDGSSLKLAFLNLKGLVVELIEPSDKSKLPRGERGNLEHLAIKVKNLPAIVEKMQRAGINFETEQPLVGKALEGVRHIFFQGPAGERLELLEYL